MIQEEALRGILGRIEGTDYKSVSSGVQLMEYGFQLQQWMAFSGSQVAECKEAVHKARRQAMVNLVASLKANGASLSPSLQKDYVNDLCGKEIMLYELAGRVNATCTHSLDFIRTCISLLKAEMQQTQ